MATPLDRLKAQLLTSGIQQENTALFQIINQLIDFLRSNTIAVQAITGGGGGGSGALGGTFLTKNKEVLLPNSLQEIAGAGIEFNDANNRRVVSTALPFIVETESSEDSFPGFPIKGDRGQIGPVGISIPGIDGLDGEDNAVNLLGIQGLIGALTSALTSVKSTAINYSVLATDYIILVTAACTITLPACGGLNGRRFYIKHESAPGDAVVVATTGGATIDGDATKTIITQYTTMEVSTDGSNWIIL